jgi:hypothetical protein
MKASAQEMEIAIAAGGLTLMGWRLNGGTGDINDERYQDPVTKMWIPRGILLWRPRPKGQEQRDVLQVEG